MKQDPPLLTSATALLLWLLTVFLGIVGLLAARTLALRTYLRFFPPNAGNQSAQTGLPLVNILVTLPLAILLIAVIIGGAEYHRRHVGEATSWHLFARTLALELSVLLLGLFI